MIDVPTLPVSPSIPSSRMICPLGEESFGRRRDLLGERLVADERDEKEDEDEQRNQRDKRLIGDSCGHERHVLLLDPRDDRLREGDRAANVDTHTAFSATNPDGTPACNHAVHLVGAPNVDPSIRPVLKQRAHRFARRYRRHRSPASGCCRGDRVRERHRVRERSPVPQGGDRPATNASPAPSYRQSRHRTPDEKLRSRPMARRRPRRRPHPRHPGHEDGVDRSAFDRCPRVFGR